MHEGCMTLLPRSLSAAPFPLSLLELQQAYASHVFNGGVFNEVAWPHTRAHLPLLSE